MKIFRLNTVSWVLLGMLLPTLATSAQFHTADYNKLRMEIESHGISAVMVNLDSIPLAEIKNNLAYVKETMHQKADKLFSELGLSAEPTGYWNNGIGQIGFYIDADGLASLVKSDEAEFFRPDSTRTSRVRAYSADGSLALVESEILDKGSAIAEIFLNLEDIDYDIEKDKVVYYRVGELAGKVQQGMDQLLAKQSKRKPLSGSVSENKPSFIATIDLETFYALRESEDVRAIKPINFKDSRPTKWPTGALPSSNNENGLEVIITLRGGEMFTASTGYISENAIKAQANANQRAFASILNSAGITKQAEQINAHPELAYFHTRLSPLELKKLQQDADPRLLSVQLNQPIANDSSLPVSELTPTETELPEPQTLCFDKSNFRGDYSNFTFNYNFVAQREDFGKEGLVFVGFRLKSSPESLFLMHGSKADNSKGWTEYSREGSFKQLTGIPLQAWVPLEIIHKPMDLSPFAGDGEILVGYGLQAYQDEPPEDIFNEMVDNNRYSVVLTVGDGFFSTKRVCVEISHINEFSTFFD